MRLVRYEETDAAGALTGRVAEFEVSAFEPLSWADLIDRKLGTASPVALRVKAGMVRKSTIAEIAEGSNVEINSVLNSPMTSLHLALVPGGWLPAGLALDVGGLMFPDRCTLAELKGRYKPGRTKKLAADFIDLFHQEGTRINPLLQALEGNSRSYPDRSDIAAQMAEATAQFRAALPKCNVVGDAPAVIDAIAGLSQSLRATAEGSMRFLMEIAPLLRHDVSKARLEGVLRQIVSIAVKNGLPMRHLAVLAAFSAASLQGRSNPARGALKLNERPYTRQHAFNAMADLRALQLFGFSLAMFPGARPMLVTGDKDLALVWAGANLDNFRLAGENQLTFTADPLPAFLPEPTQQAWRWLVREEIAAPTASDTR